MLTTNRARFLSLAWSKLRLCSANHRAGYWSNLPCDWPSTARVYSEQETENGSRLSVLDPFVSHVPHLYHMYPSHTDVKQRQLMESCVQVIITMFVSLFLHTMTWHKHTFHITDPLWGKSSGHWWVTGPVRGIHQSPEDYLHLWPVMSRCNDYFVVSLNKLLNKQSSYWWFEVPLQS